MYPLSFKSDICYLRNKRIEEWDMRSAGYSITISEGLIEDSKILEDLRISDKHDRQVILGLYSKNNKEYVKALNDGFRKYITAFIELNDVPECNLLFIKKDAITFFDATIKRSRFKKCEFTRREVFTSYLRIGRLELYINSKEKRNLVKGITLNSYKDTLIEEIFKIMYLAEYSSKGTVETKLAELRQAYVKRELVDNYYRELSVNNAFLLKEDTLQGNTVYTNLPISSDDQFFEDVDINYNYVNILMPLFEVMVG